MSKKTNKLKKEKNLTGYESAQRKRFLRYEQNSANQEFNSVMM